MPGLSPRPQVETFPRPYALTFLGTGQAYPLSSQEASRLIAGVPDPGGYG